MSFIKKTKYEVLVRYQVNKSKHVARVLTSGYMKWDANRRAIKLVKESFTCGVIKTYNRGKID